MGEASDNMQAIALKNQPSVHPSFQLMGGVKAAAMIKPGFAFVMHSDCYRAADGEKHAEWRPTPNGPWVDADGLKVWIVEEHGPLPPDAWVFGLFPVIALADPATGRIVECMLNSPIGSIGVGDVKNAERELLFGGGQRVPTNGKALRSI